MEQGDTIVYKYSLFILSLLQPEWNWYYVFLSRNDLAFSLRVNASEFDYLLSLVSIACAQNNVCGDSTAKLVNDLTENKKYLIKDWHMQPQSSIASSSS